MKDKLALIVKILWTIIQIITVITPLLIGSKKIIIDQIDEVING